VFEAEACSRSRPTRPTYFSIGALVVTLSIELRRRNLRRAEEALRQAQLADIAFSGRTVPVLQ
jgi:hypothetical protein